MKITLSVIKADIGGYVGHSESCPDASAKASECLAKAKKNGLLVDCQVTRYGDDLQLIMTPQQLSSSHKTQKPSGETFVASTEVTKPLELYSAGQDLPSDAFSGNIKGMGPAIAEMEIEERKAEPVITFMADKTSPGVWNMPLYETFNDPFDTFDLVITANMHSGFTFKFHDACKTSSRAKNRFVVQPADYEVDPRLCFVIMPFRSYFNSVYAVIKRTARARGMTCRRADEVIGQGSIMDKIWSLIGSAEVVIADITENNCNVYHEIGIARALGKTPILLWAEGGDTISSDLVGLEYIKYENLIDGDRELSWRLGMAIDEIMKRVAS